MSIFFEKYREIITEFDNFIEALHQPLPVHIRVNTLKIQPEELIQLLSNKGNDIEISVSGFKEFMCLKGNSKPGNLLEYELGYFHLQALTSCLASHVLSPQPGEVVLDMCSAPGGKTSHMAMIMNNKGLIIANELNPKRYNSLGYNLSRLGVLNTIITGYQAQQFPMRFRFDRILMDVPCSGEGTFRILHSRSTYRETRKKKRLPELQKKMILRGFDILKGGGEMLYSTCTYNPEENEGVVDFLLKNRDAKILPINLPLNCDEAITSWKGEDYDSRVRLCKRFYPHRVNSVGFFMARIGK